MSFQSDLLSIEDQKLLYDEAGDVPYLLFQETPTDLLDEETTLMADALVYDAEIEIPKPLTSVLTNEEYIGPFNFEVDIIPNGSKNAWVYSAPLNKVYMDIRSPFPIDFKLKQRPRFPLFIRVTPMYSSPQFAQECVYRCINHEFSDEQNERHVLQHVRHHVIRCQNGNTQYIGDKQKNERLSVIIPLSVPQTGTDSIREMFEFTCKNSCPSPGMNRRAIEVIFTLEDVHSMVYGRKALNVRICSCPKRDKEKDEKDNAGKLQPPQGKKRKIEKPSKKVAAANNDNEEYTIQIPIVGKQNIKEVLKYCHNLMAGEIVRQAGNGADAIAPYRKVFSKIGDMLTKGNE